MCSSHTSNKAPIRRESLLPFIFLASRTLIRFRVPKIVLDSYFSWTLISLGARPGGPGLLFLLDSKQVGTNFVFAFKYVKKYMGFRAKRGAKIAA